MTVVTFKVELEVLRSPVQGPGAGKFGAVQHRQVKYQQNDVVVRMRVKVNDVDQAMSADVCGATLGASVVGGSAELVILDALRTMGVRV